MEWTKAKNFTLFLLVVINIMLLGLNIQKNRNNLVSSERINNITNVCGKSNISISCSLPQDITPAFQLGIKEYSYDYVKLQQIFFGTMSDIKRTNDLNSVIFTRNDEKLTVENSKAVFVGEKKDYTNCINSINELLGDFDIKREMGGSECCFQSYMGLPVFSNYILVDNSSENKTTITLNYSEILRAVGSRESVIGSDEAVYYAIDAINEDINGEKTITSVEKGYYDSRTAISREGAIPPVYAVYVNDRVYFVNGYTGICYRQ